MASQTYMDGRVKYSRPQAMLWSKNSGTLVDGFYYPDNAEIGVDQNTIAGILVEDFLTLSDHNRNPINIKTNRIEQRERMINGRMRSYHIADKLEISTSWSMIPSRAFSLPPVFDPETGNAFAYANTADGGAGGEEMLAWYEENTGPFWVFLAYDKYKNFGTNSSAYAHLNQYNQVVEMYITNFDYSVEKRGGTNHDLWNVSVTLEEA